MPSSPKLAARRVLAKSLRQLLRLRARPLQPAAGSTLVLAPHPDDETLGCGGAIAWSRKNSLPVRIVFLTDGAASHPGHPRVSPTELAQLRRSETLAASASLGVEPRCIHFLDIADGTLAHLSSNSHQQLVARLTAIVQKDKPTRVFLPLARDGSSEHDVVSGFLQDALTRSGMSPELLHYPVWAAWRPQLLLSPALNARRIWSLQLGGLRARKCAALNHHTTQVAPLAPWTHPTLSAEFQEMLTGEWEFFFQW